MAETNSKVPGAATIIGDLLPRSVKVRVDLKVSITEDDLADARAEVQGIVDGEGEVTEEKVLVEAVQARVTKLLRGAFAWGPGEQDPEGEGYEVMAIEPEETLG